MRKNIIITGRPGSGKSTLARKIAERLKSLKIDVAGVITPEIREKKVRIGFEVVGIKSGQKKLLAVKAENFQAEKKSKIKIGKYLVFPENFLQILKDESKYQTEVLIIDEIGPMELGGSKNLNTVWLREILSSNAQKVITVKKDLSSELSKLSPSAVFIDLDNEDNNIAYAKVLEAVTQTEAFLIDLDGVIIDSGEFHKLSWIELMKKLGVGFSEDDFKKTFGMTNSTILKMFLGEIPDEDVKRLSEEKERIYRDLAKGKIKLIKGSKDFLEFIKENKRLKTALVSSTPMKNIDFIFSELGIGKFFDVVISGEDVERGKPDPECYTKALNKLGVAPQKAWVIEDSQHGIYSARDAGTKCIGILTTHKNLEDTDILAKDFYELQKFLNSIFCPL